MRCAHSYQVLGPWEPQPERPRAHSWAFPRAADWTPKPGVERMVCPRLGTLFCTAVPGLTMSGQACPLVSICVSKYLLSLLFWTEHSRGQKPCLIQERPPVPVLSMGRNDSDRHLGKPLSD